MWWSFPCEDIADAKDGDEENRRRKSAGALGACFVKCLKTTEGVVNRLNAPIMSGSCTGKSKP